MKKYNYFLFIVAILLVFSAGEVTACAMCKETGDGSTGFSNRGINFGILYLMVIPYIAFSVLAYFWYKASKKEKKKQQRIVNALEGNQ